MHFRRHSRHFTLLLLLLLFSLMLITIRQQRLIPGPVLAEAGSQPGSPKVSGEPAYMPAAAAATLFSTDVATATATRTPQPTRPAPTVTPEPMEVTAATSTRKKTVVPSGPPWLTYLNQFRSNAHLSALKEFVPLSAGSQEHAVYMVKTDNGIAHYQDKESAFYTEAGTKAAKNGNLFYSTIFDTTPDWAINYWMSAAFHILPILNPALESVGFGHYTEDSGSVKMAAVLDARSGWTRRADPGAYPIMFPGDGRQTWILQHTMFEYPDTYSSCPGYNYSSPTGPAIVLMIGNGRETPHVNRHAFLQGDTQLLASCIFDETNYVNPDPYEQEVGRIILGEFDAIILIPARPLETGQTYGVEIDVNGTVHRWHFDAVSRPGLE